MKKDASVTFDVNAYTLRLPPIDESSRLLLSTTSKIWIHNIIYILTYIHSWTLYVKTSEKSRTNRSGSLASPFLHHRIYCSLFFVGPGTQFVFTHFFLSRELKRRWWCLFYICSMQAGKLSLPLNRKKKDVFIYSWTQFLLPSHTNKKMYAVAYGQSADLISPTFKCIWGWQLQIIFKRW